MDVLHFCLRGWLVVTPSRYYISFLKMKVKCFSQIVAASDRICSVIVRLLH
jgi:hypothetical protein